MILFLFHFVQVYKQFRLSEWKSILEVLKLTDIAEYDQAKVEGPMPLLLVLLQSREQALAITKRAILVKAVYEIWADAPNLTDLLNAHSEHIKAKYSPKRDLSWKFVFAKTGLKGKKSIQSEEAIRMFTEALDITAPVDLVQPQLELGLISEYVNDTELKHVYFGEFISEGPRRLITKYSLKKRSYISTTSMDAELSLITANLALARDGALVYDPFCGTGSFLLTCAEFGCYGIGSDVDGKQLRGNTKWMHQHGRSSEGLKSLACEYGVSDRILGGIVCDFKKGMWRVLKDKNDGNLGDFEIFDAIVTDPPYGVRAGAKKVTGMLDVNKSNEFKHANNYSVRSKVQPVLENYDMEELVDDLVDFAAHYLKPKGRLVFWLPTITQDFMIDDIPQHPKLRLVSNSSQKFNKWERRLITMEKLPSQSCSTEDVIHRKQRPAHARFRVKYFNGFSTRSR